ncbi:MAG: response regulator [Piscinibacter sp.]|uniref:response regulator n=1 Tax=Piscinibacter TaxID=1114981 RepID=UPI000FDF177E|nr:MULTISPECIES: response regulator [Piscinibacter]MCW5664264.1 response regulator [Piscinibacter sp.]
MARLLYPDIGDCRALIVDPNPTSRSILAAMLRDMGVGEVAQAAKADDARRVLEHRRFDIVLCDYHFDQSAMSGQDLLDDLRRAQLLPYSTVFVMVTGEASYARVAEAAEAALDSYLLKPHTATALEERLLQARHRKKVLAGVFEAIEAGDFATAAALCQQRFEQRGEYWLYAARIGAELFLRLGDHPSARRLYEAVQDTRALPWAKLGIARVEIETGQHTQARRTLESLIAEQPSYADAYDVMGRAQLEQGKFDAALDTYRNATKLTPASITRLQKQGLLAFLVGQADEAQDCLERAVRIGISSKMFDCESLLLLALIHFDKRDSKAFGRDIANLSQAVERRPESARLRRFLRTAEVFRALMQRQVPEAVAKVRELSAEIGAEDFDFEAASNLLATLARLASTEIALPDREEWINRIALRFCVSRAATELLCQASRADGTVEALVRAAHQGVMGMAEKAMTHSVTGSPEAAVKALLVRGRETLNGKLIEMAALMLQRHGEKVAAHADLSEMIGDLRRRFCHQGTQVALGSAVGRSAGGLTLRS